MAGWRSHPRGLRKSERTSSPGGFAHQRASRHHSAEIAQTCPLRYGVGSVRVFRLPHEPAACCFGESRTGSDIMKKSLRRVLARLRAATNGTFGKRMGERGLSAPQRMLPVPAPSR